MKYVIIPYLNNLDNRCMHAYHNYFTVYDILTTVKPLLHHHVLSNKGCVRYSHIREILDNVSYPEIFLPFSNAKEKKRKSYFGVLSTICLCRCRSCCGCSCGCHVLSAQHCSNNNITYRSTVLVYVYSFSYITSGTLQE